MARGLLTALVLLSAVLSIGGVQWQHGPCKCDGTAALEDLCTKGGACEVVGAFEIECDLARGSCGCTCEFDGDLSMEKGSLIGCKGGARAGFLCFVNFYVKGSVHLQERSAIEVSTFRLFADGNVTVMSGAYINATGQGLSSRHPDRQLRLDFGGSNGGLGGQSSCSAKADLTSGPFGDPVEVWQGWLDPKQDDGESGYGYGGGSKLATIQDGLGRGGGRIALVSKGQIDIGGIISADGTPSEPSCLADCGSGAGGTIFLNATAILGDGSGDIEPEMVMSAISAVGGASKRNASGAGGGGRIGLLATDSMVFLGSFEVRAFGGRASDKEYSFVDSRRRAEGVELDPRMRSLGVASTSNCLNGAAGTILRAQFSQNASLYIGSMQISNCPTSSACEFAYASTPFLYPTTTTLTSGKPALKLPLKLVSVQINKYATVNSTRIELEPLLGVERASGIKVDPGLVVNAGRLTSALSIRADSFQLSGSAIETFDQAKLHVSPGDFILDDASSMAFTGLVQLHVQGDTKIQGSVHADEGIAGGVASKFFLSTKSLDIAPGSVIKGQQVSVIATHQANVSGAVSSMASETRSCAQQHAANACEKLHQANQAGRLVDLVRARGLLRGAHKSADPLDLLTNFSISIVVMSGDSEPYIPLFRLPHTYQNPASLMAHSSGSAIDMHPTAAPTTPAPTPSPTATNVTIAEDLLLNTGAELSGRSILLCAGVMHIHGSVKSSGQGCSSESGPGVGCTSNSGAGGGAGHGGVGGAGLGCSDTGERYGDSLNPLLSGSGGGAGPSGIAGGNGGGVVSMGARKLVVLEGRVLSDGSPGDGSKQAAAGGGGSGGSIIMSSPSICSLGKQTEPLLSAIGGEGGQGGGGGGGGGRIAVNFTDESFVIDLGLAKREAWLKEVATHAAHSIALMRESASRSRRKASLRRSLWKPSDISCTHFGNLSVSLDVSGGAQGNQTDLRVAELHRVKDSRQGSRGSLHSPFCSAGHGGAWCSLCDPGYYKSIAGPSECSKCESRHCISKKTCAWMAHGITTSDCPVICSPGYVLPNCLSPLENLIDAMGGVVVFAAVIAAFGLLLVILFTCVCTRVEWCPGYYANEEKMRKKRLETARLLREHRREVGFQEGADGRHLRLLSSRHTSEDLSSGISPGGSSGDVYQILDVGGSSSRGGNKRVRTPGMNNLRTERLSENDIPYHITRVYLAGDNSVFDPWVMPSKVPAVLEGMDVLDGEKYAAMVSQVNNLARHSTVTMVLSIMLHVLCYPIGAMYMTRQRHVRAYKLLEFFETYDHACVNNTRSRALMNTFKFGSDRDSTLCYVEILANKPIDPLSQESRLPLVLFLSGNGSYWSPFYLNWSDVLVRAVPHLVKLRSFIDQAWSDLVNTKLNPALRAVDPFMVQRTVQRSLRLLDRCQADKDALGGLSAKLGLFPTPGFENGSQSKLRLAIVLDRDEGRPSLYNDRHTFVSAGGDEGTETSFLREDGGERLLNGRLSPYHSFDVHASALEGFSDVTESKNVPSGQGSPNNFLGTQPSTSMRSVSDPFFSDAEKRAGAAAVEAFEQEERKRLAAEGASINQDFPPVQPSRSSSLTVFSNANADESSRIEAPVSVPSPAGVAGGRGSISGSRVSDLEGPVVTDAPSQTQAVDATFAQPSSSSSSSSPRSPSSSSGVRRAMINNNGHLLVRRDYFTDDDEAEEEEEDSDSHQQYGLECMSLADVAKVYSVLRLSLGILANRAPRKRDSLIFFRSVITFLLVLDIASTFILLTTFFCVDHNGQPCVRIFFFLIVFIYPFALVVGPLLGLTLVIFPLSGIGRQYSVWNALSMINALVACIISLIFREKFAFDAGFFSVFLLIIKFAQNRLVDRYLALIETDKSLPSSDR